MVEVKVWSIWASITTGLLGQKVQALASAHNSQLYDMQHLNYQHFTNLSKFSYQFNL